MRPSFVVYFLVLSLIIAKTQGIRLGKGSLTVDQQQKQQGAEENTLLKRSNNNDNVDHDSEEAVTCKDEQCTGNIKNRKLVAISASTTTLTISKNVEGNEDEQKVNGNRRNVKVNNGAGEIKVNMSNKAKGVTQQEQFPDLDDIVEMDYSPARRKPPIHN